MYIVYALIDPRDSSIHYVGFTSNLVERFVTHLRNREVNRHKIAWMKDLIAQGMLPYCRTLHTCNSEREARAIEDYWIQAFYDSGQPLTNWERTGRR